MQFVRGLKYNDIRIRIHEKKGKYFYRNNASMIEQSKVDSNEMLEQGTSHAGGNYHAVNQD